MHQYSFQTVIQKILHCRSFSKKKKVSFLLAVSGLFAFIALSHPSELSLLYAMWLNLYYSNLYLHLLHTTVHFQERSRHGVKTNNLASNVIWTKSVDGVGAELSNSVTFYLATVLSLIQCRSFSHCWLYFLQRKGKLQAQQVFTSISCCCYFFEELIPS